MNRFGLPCAPASCIRTPMISVSTRQDTRFAAFTAQTLRALSSTVLLLGLIGDRRAR